MKLTDKFVKLIDVKSIMTILLTIVFCILAAKEIVSAEQFLTVYTVVVSFFFGVKSGQDQSKKE
jgi:hypothetical protein